MAAGECTQDELDAAADLIVGSITRSTQTAGDILQWYMDRYDEEGIVRDFDAGLDQLRQVTLKDVAELCSLVITAPERGVSLLGRLDEAEAKVYMAALELKSQP